VSEYARRPRRKYCLFCKDKVEHIDYKDVQQLKRFTTDRGKIKPRRVTGTCAQHQHELSMAVKRAREMALLPYAVPVISTGSERRGRRG
jgi:small subunit ribosomal protein S18